MKMGIKGIIISVVSALAGATLIAFGGYRSYRFFTRASAEKKIGEASKELKNLESKRSVELNANKGGTYDKEKEAPVYTKLSEQGSHTSNNNEAVDLLLSYIKGEVDLGAAPSVAVSVGLADNSQEQHRKCVENDAKAKVKLMQTQIQQLEQDIESLGCVDEKSKETLEGIIKEMKDMALKNTFKPDDDWVGTLGSAYSLCYEKPAASVCDPSTAKKCKDRIMSIESELQKFRKALDGGKKYSDNSIYHKISGMVLELKGMLNNDDFCPNMQWKNILCGAKNLLDTMDKMMLSEEARSMRSSK